VNSAAPKIVADAEPRQQYAALPYRKNDGVEILLISSRETKRWVLPKGWPMKGRKPYAAAAREAMEEAGLVGKISRQSLGSYRYDKRLKNGAVVSCQVMVFPMLVEKQRKSWPEKEQRTTRWFALSEAADAVAEPDLKAVILAFSAFIKAAPRKA
jgi:8-oxo-dGTP pyrophosphatase MutT (NUDIX family)